MTAHTRHAKNGAGGEERVFVSAQPDPEVLRIPAAKYITLEGSGAPEGAAFQAAVAALYGVVFTIKFANKTNKKSGGADFKVSPLEGLWWAHSRFAEAHPTRLSEVPRAEWRWKLMIRMPAAITKHDVDAAKAAVRAKRGDGPVANVALERIAEGLVVQVMHVGPYATEPDTIARMRALMVEEGYAPKGAHHEIYLGDPRRTKPKKLRTILRQPVERAPVA